MGSRETDTVEERHAHTIALIITNYSFLKVMVKTQHIYSKT